MPKLVAYYIDHAYIDERRLQGHVLAETQAGGYKEVHLLLRAPSRAACCVNLWTCEPVRRTSSCITARMGLRHPGSTAVHTHVPTRRRL